MALTDVYIDDTRYTDDTKSTTEQTRIGKEGDTVTVETTRDGRTTTRAATEREIAAYEAAKAEADRKAALSTARSATTVVELRDALIAAGVL